MLLSVVRGLLGVVAPVLGVLRSVIATLGVMAQVNVSPNQSLPGTKVLETAVGGLMTASLVTCVAAVVFGGGAWAFGERRANVTAAHLGRRLVEGGMLGAVVIGGATALVNHAFGLGGGL